MGNLKLEIWISALHFCFSLVTGVIMLQFPGMRTKFDRLILRAVRLVDLFLLWVFTVYG